MLQKGQKAFFRRKWIFSQKALFLASPFTVCPCACFSVSNSPAVIVSPFVTLVGLLFAFCGAFRVCLVYLSVSPRFVLVWAYFSPLFAFGVVLLVNKTKRAGAGARFRLVPFSRPLLLLWVFCVSNNPNQPTQTSLYFVLRGFLLVLCCCKLL